MEAAFLSAAEQADLIRRRELSPVELVEECLRRVEKLDPTLNAFVSCTGDEALDAARTAEAALARHDDVPRFHGVPIAIKDLTNTAGIPTTYSSKAFANHVPDKDAAVVRRIKGAGFIVIGKTNTCEFGTVPVTESDLNGICHNPWNPDNTPGGSSGGAAAGVAAGMVSVAQGTDGGGSIRIPSSCCGLFGMKPARGRVSHAPKAEQWSGLSTSGPIARSVRDAATLLDVMSGYETGDPYWLPPPKRPFEAEVGDEPGRLRVAFTTVAPNGTIPDPEVVAAVDDAARLLASLGHDVEDATPEWVDPDAGINFIRTGMATSTAYHDVPDLSLLEPLNQMLADIGKQTSSLEFVKAMESLRAYTRGVVGFFNSYDVLLTPTLALTPVRAGWLFEDDDPWEQLRRSGSFTPFTPIANVTGQPAMSVPLFWSDDGLPVGVQFIGRPGDEATLFRLAGQLEAARPWAERRPPVS